MKHRLPLHGIRRLARRQALSVATEIAALHPGAGLVYVHHRSGLAIFIHPAAAPRKIAPAYAAADRIVGAAERNRRGITCATATESPARPADRNHVLLRESGVPSSLSTVWGQNVSAVSGSLPSANPQRGVADKGAIAALARGHHPQHPGQRAFDIEVERVAAPDPPLAIAQQHEHALRRRQLTWCKLTAVVGDALTAA